MMLAEEGVGVDELMTETFTAQLVGFGDMESTQDRHAMLEALRENQHIVQELDQHVVAAE